MFIYTLQDIVPLVVLILVVLVWFCAHADWTIKARRKKPTDPPQKDDNNV